MPQPDEPITVYNPGRRPVEVHHAGRTEVVGPRRRAELPAAAGFARAHVDELVRLRVLEVLPPAPPPGPAPARRARKQPAPVPPPAPPPPARTGRPGRATNPRKRSGGT